ncbi:gamma-glutamylcyclotransferase [Bacillus sp. NEB1478]|uniref:gamma-glutamylcyclotransferase family protein n=1 Tax=Bacillus sp. NEB1478 TaxID=3073816 RepID=UPI002873A64C|nr:gamma-glutamylcyclotransferase [Bacillus sp. NEB1478]WNB91211.1 gamma-glutamylcyclotransferase [Bacillus sp. NEB1478]
MEDHLVFVYGTLRKNEANSHYLHQAECIEENCKLEGQLYDTGHGYPALFQEKGDNPVIGEVYKVTTEQLKQLDRLEGYEEGCQNNLYEKLTCRVKTQQGERDCIVYVMNKKMKHFKRISDNDWIKYRT